MIWLMVFLFFLLIVLGVPITFAMGISAVSYIVYQQIPLMMVAQRFFSQTQSFPFLAVPFFMLAGSLMVESGIAKKIVDFAFALVGRLPGGLGCVSVLSNMIMGGVSGSSVADCAAIGSVLVPTMNEQGYDRSFTASINATASTMGIIIPPSSTMVVLGWMTNISVGKMFLGGIIPGILIGIGYFIVTVVISLRRNYPRANEFSFRRLWASFKESALALVLPFIIVGFIVFGIATPTEVAAVAVLYALVLGVFVYRTLDLAKIRRALVECATGTVVVMMVVCSASIFTWLLIRERVPDLLAAGLTSISSNPIVIITIMNIVLFIAGMVNDLVANLMLLVPVFMPIAMKIGMDPVHFGVMVVVSLALGLYTPPVGSTLFISCQLGGVEIQDVWRDLVPYFVVGVIVALLVAYVPWTVTYIPNLLMK